MELSMYCTVYCTPFSLVLNFRFVVLEALFGRLWTARVNIHNSTAFPVFSSQSLSVLRGLCGNAHRCRECGCVRVWYVDSIWFICSLPYRCAIHTPVPVHQDVNMIRSSHTFVTPSLGKHTFTYPQCRNACTRSSIGIVTTHSKCISVF